MERLRERDTHTHAQIHTETDRRTERQKEGLQECIMNLRPADKLGSAGGSSDEIRKCLSCLATGFKEKCLRRFSWIIRPILMIKDSFIFNFVTSIRSSYHQLFFFAFILLYCYVFIIYVFSCKVHHHHQEHNISYFFVFFFFIL